MQADYLRLTFLEQEITGITSHDRQFENQNKQQWVQQSNLLTSDN
jgi:hypothetical protein